MRPIFSAALLIACADPELSGSADLAPLERAGLPAPPVAPAAAWSALGTVDASFGESVALAGDVNGDGYDDVLVGAPGHSNGELEEGGAFLYLGSPTGLQLVPAWTTESNQAGARFGASVASAGDVNGDGFDDVVIGAPAYSAGETEEGGPSCTSDPPRACPRRPPGPPRATASASPSGPPWPRPAT
ncbi:MAG: FG-GAP repeat protein [Alphaproteobacteria bacterium]|nr:FG-GAP repeat protein [Alphaproteobacteria bacterium]